MREKIVIELAPALLALAAVMVLGCSGKKESDAGADDAGHFGVAEVNHPKFEGAGDFNRRLAEVYGIVAKGKLGGEPVDMSWIGDAFREKLCLTLTINNHCVG